MSNVQTTINEMHNGSIEIILQGISSTTPLILLNAIIAGTKLGIKEKEFVEGLKKAEQSEEMLMGVPIKEFASASLEILEIQKYLGDNNRVKEMVQCKLNF